MLRYPWTKDFIQQKFSSKNLYVMYPLCSDRECLYGYLFMRELVNNVVLSSSIAYKNGIFVFLCRSQAMACHCQGAEKASGWIQTIILVLAFLENL